MTTGMVKTVMLDVSGVQTMQLITDLNDNPMYDHTDWANAKLLTWHETDYISDLGYTEDYTNWPLRPDRSIDNNPLTLNGVEYAKGLGSHAYSAITVELNGEYDLFGSVIGIDDEVTEESGSGNSTFTVYLDGEEVYNSGVITSGMTDTILLDVSGADQLQLVTYVNDDPMYDHTDWANARLIKYREQEPGDSTGAVGVYYLRERYYRPTTGRFVSEDPIRSGLNYYAYCGNNPLFFVDPWGLIEVGLRAYSEGYGATVGWNASTGYASVTYNGQTLYVKSTAQNNKGGHIYIDDSVLNKEFGWSMPGSPSYSSVNPVGKSNINISIIQNTQQNTVLSSKLPSTGKPNSTQDLLNPDGSLKQQRWYGPDGRPVRDRDYNHPGDGHVFPHDHYWDWEKTPPRQPSVPVPVPAPTPNPGQTNYQYGHSNQDEKIEAAGWSLFGTALYWIISEGSRFALPMRNLVPVP
jgi:RHS repeat-associated protein